MEIGASETRDKGVDKDLAGNPGAVYSMTGDTQPREASSDEGAFFEDRAEAKHVKHPTAKHEDSKKAEQKKNKEIVTWRMGIGILIILLITGLVYFAIKGVNWGISKVSGDRPTASYIPSLRTNADPNSAVKTGPVISNMNIYPAGGSMGQVAGVSTTMPTNASSGSSGSVGPSNCPDYLAGQYYYCEWLDGVNFRPYKTQEEYLQTKAAKSTYTSTTSTNYIPNASYTPPIYTPPTYSGYTPSGYTPPAKAGVNCPDYDAKNYDYCVWYSPLMYRGFNYGQ